MKTIRSTVIILFVTGFTFSLFAQDSERNKRIALETQVAQQLLYDLEKLPPDQNRAFVLVKAGQYLCRNDKPRAEKLFERAIKELIIAQNNAEKPVGNDPGYLYYGFSPRLFMIDSISQCDAELGYQYLQKSLPRSLSEIINDYYKNSILLKENNWGNYSLRWELTRERNLKSKITDKKPERLAEFINQDLKNYITPGTLNLLKALYKTDPTLAKQLTEKVFEKLLQLTLFDENKKPTLIEDGYNFQIAQSFLSALGKDQKYEKYPIRVSDELLMRFTDKFSQELLDNGFSWVDESALKIIRRFFPDRSDQFEQRRAEKLKDSESQRYRELIESKSAG